jgi:hypothetical protein
MGGPLRTATHGDASPAERASAVLEIVPRFACDQSRVVHAVVS